MSTRRARILWLLLPVLGLLFAWGWWTGAARLAATQRELAARQRRLERLETETRALAREVRALEQERATRERAARETLSAIAPGETLVVVPRRSPTPAANGT